MLPSGSPEGRRKGEDHQAIKSCTTHLCLRSLKGLFLYEGIRRTLARRADIPRPFATNDQAKVFRITAGAKMAPSSRQRQHRRAF